MGEICENGIVVKKDDFVERFDLYRLSILLVDSFMDEREEWEKVMFLILNEILFLLWIFFLLIYFFEFRFLVLIGFLLILLCK